jgi:SAM-dependent methyltransferase
VSYSGKYAECYDLFYQEKPYEDEARYVENLIKVRSPSAQSILDLGCGTGLRCLEMARHGYQVSGVDQSPAMVAIARQHLSAVRNVSAGAVEFFEGDITNFAPGGSWDAVVSLFHVFSYLTTDESLKKAVESSFSNLRPGGVLLFDYWHGPGVLNDPPSTRTKHAENSTLSVIRKSVPTHISDKHLVKLSLSIEITDKDTKATERAEETYLLRYWFLDELERCLHGCGFHNICHYGWLTQSAPESETWQACTVAVKP